MKGIKLILTLLALLILLVAAWQNIPPILEKNVTLRLDLYWVKWQTNPIPLYLIIPTCFVVGFGLMWLLDLSTRMRLRRQIRILEKEVRSVRSQAGLDSSTPLESYADEPFEDEVQPPDSDETLVK